MDQPEQPAARGEAFEHPKDPLHGVTLERILTRLVDYYGWDGLARVIDIKCFRIQPSVKSSNASRIGASEKAPSFESRSSLPLTVRLEPR